MERGDHLALLASNSREWVWACLAVISAGAVVVPLDVHSGMRPSVTFSRIARQARSPRLTRPDACSRRYGRRVEDHPARCRGR